MYDAQVGRWMRVDSLSYISWRWICYTYVENNPIRSIDQDGRSSIEHSTNLASLDIGPDCNIIHINADGDPGVYMNLNGVRVLVGFMDPDKKYKIGSLYHYYGKKDYYDRFPMATWFGMKLTNPNDPNPDQNNDEATKKDALGASLLAIFFNEIGELFEGGTPATKGYLLLAQEQLTANLQNKWVQFFLMLPMRLGLGLKMKNF